MQNDKCFGLTAVEDAQRRHLNEQLDSARDYLGLLNQVAKQEKAYPGLGDTGSVNEAALDAIKQAALYGIRSVAHSIR